MPYSFITKENLIIILNIYDDVYIHTLIYTRTHTYTHIKILLRITIISFACANDGRKLFNQKEHVDVKIYNISSTVSLLFCVCICDGKAQKIEGGCQ